MTLGSRTAGTKTLSNQKGKAILIFQYPEVSTPLQPALYSKLAAQDRLQGCSPKESQSQTIRKWISTNKIMNDRSPYRHPPPTER